MSSITEIIQEYEQKTSLTKAQKSIITKLFELDTEKGVKFTNLMEQYPDIKEEDLDDELFELAFLGIVHQPAIEYYKLIIHYDEDKR